MNSLLDRMNIPLTRPFKIGGVEQTSLTMFEPKVRDKIMFSKDKGDQEEKTARMIARLLNVEASDLMDLPACDYERLETAFNELVKAPDKRNSTLFG